MPAHRKHDPPVVSDRRSREGEPERIGNGRHTLSSATAIPVSEDSSARRALSAAGTREPPPLIEVCDLAVQRRRGDQTLEVSRLAVAAGEVLALIGPNGAGKSTLLHALGSLIRPSAGELRYRGERVSAARSLAYRRRVALVMQHPLLLAGGVFANVATGLRLRGMPRSEINLTVERWLHRLGIAHLRSRKAHRLSGGEAQRVSLARAFALQPEVLLLDEPFGALDPPTRLQLLEDLHTLLAETGTTAVFVTHDTDEARVLGDRVAVLLEGALRQCAAVDEVFSRPADLGVARFVGMETRFPGRISKIDDSGVEVATNGTVLTAADGPTGCGPVMVCVRPEAIRVTRTDEARGESQFRGRVVSVMPQGAGQRVVIDCGVRVVALVPSTTAEDASWTPGDTAAVHIPARAVHLLPR